MALHVPVVSTGIVPGALSLLLNSRGGSNMGYKRIAWLSLLTIAPVVAQQTKFEIADVHVSPTARDSHRISAVSCATDGT